MTLPCAAGSQILFSSATVACLSQVFLGLITTVNASKATGISMYSMPALRQSSISAAKIGRDALDISVSPRQNFLNPPPVPDTPTVTFKPLLAFWNSSATASVTGYTVLEPSILTTWAELSAGMPPSKVKAEIARIDLMGKDFIKFPFKNYKNIENCSVQPT